MSPEFYQGPFDKLFTDDVKFIDVRAPVEFCQGAFPNTINLPLLSDQQRHLIGICYKELGQVEAIAMGHRLVSGEDRREKMEAWLSELNLSVEETYLYCFRGGLRSQISQQWIRELGGKVQIIEGGYKRLRSFLLENIEQQVDTNSFLVLTGNTGTGKTDLLHRFSNDGYKTIDLESFANHRGSVFGSNSTPQPSQINFENKLSIQFLKEMKKKGTSILLEDEGRKVGHRVVPLSLNLKQGHSPIFVLEKSIDDRVALILEDYCIASWKKFQNEDDSYQKFFQYFKSSFDQIEKKLGGALYQECLQILNDAINNQEQTGSFSVHQDWISKILIQYYDPHYEIGLNRKKEFIIGRGDESALREILK